MKKISLLVVIISLLLLSGCNIKYNLTVTDKGVVKEKAYFLQDNKNILENNDDINLYLEEKIAPYQTVYSSYKYYKHKGLLKSYILVQKEYESLSNYATNSNLFKNLFERGEVTGTNNNSFRTVGKFYYDKIYDDTVDPTFYINKIEINIRFYNNVLDNNADKVNKVTNTYTWIIDETTETKDIYFKTGTKVQYNAVIYQFITDNLIAVLITSGVIILALLITLMVRLKQIENNRL